MCCRRSWMWSHTTFAADSTSSWEERRGWTMGASPGEIKQMCRWFFNSCCVLSGQQGFPLQGLEFNLTYAFNDGHCGAVGALFYNFTPPSFFFLEILANCRVCRLLHFSFMARVWITVVLQRLCCKSLLLFPWRVHHTLSSLSSLPRSITTSVHHMYSSLSLFSPCSGSFFLYMFIIFRLAAGSCVLLISLILHCVSVSGVSSVVLPYGRWHHAVLPQGRTTDGMLEGVCVHTSVHTHLLS